MSKAPEPLMLADGTIIEPMTGRVLPSVSKSEKEKLVAIPTHQEAVREVTAVRRKLADLPDVPRNTNLPAAILTYTLFGLQDFEIAHAFGITEQQVATIKQGDVYQRLNDAIVVSLIEQETDNVRNLFTANARKAANKLTDLIDSRNESVALNASKDLLDRASLGAALNVNHSHNFNGLEIVVRDKRGSLNNQPIIEGEFQ